MSTKSTYHIFPNTEERLGTTPFHSFGNAHFLDYLNLLTFAGGAAFFFYYFIDNFDSIGYIMFIFGILIVCEIFLI
jgi:hypothetical protein